MSTSPGDTPAASAGRRAVNGCFRTPWGDGRVTVWRGRLTGVQLPPLAKVSTPEVGGTAWPEDREALERWVADLEAYFRGERLSWSAEEVDLESGSVSGFAQAVYRALSLVPAGATVGYGVLAAIAGYPGAARAVGTCMAKNRIPVVVPCHRVIRRDGSLGRYGSDPAWKERLLAHERLHAGEDGGRE